MIVIFARLVLRPGLFRSYSVCIRAVMFAGYVFVSSLGPVLLCKPSPYSQKAGLPAMSWLYLTGYNLVMIALEPYSGAILDYSQLSPDYSHSPS